MDRLNKTYRIPGLIIIAIIFIIWHTAVPFLGFKTPAVINVAVFILVLFYIFAEEGRALLSDFVKILPIFLISILDILVKKGDVYVNIYGLLQRMALPLICLFLLRNKNREDVSKIFWWVIIGYFITSVTTYLGCMAYPSASRFQAAVGDEDNPEVLRLYRSLNIGSFTFIYTIVLVIPLMLYYVKQKKSHYYFAAVFILMGIFAIIQSEYTTAFLLMACEILLLFFPATSNAKAFKRSIFPILIIVLCIIAVLPLILESIMHFVGSERIADRMEDLIAAWTGNISYSGEGDMELRQNQYEISWETFVSHPVFGVLGWGQDGGHSFFLDNLARYGLIGLGLMIYMVYTIYKLFIKPYKSFGFYGYILVVLLLAIVMAILNPKDNLIVLIFISPLFAYSNLSFNEQVEDEGIMDCE